MAEDEDNDGIKQNYEEWLAIDDNEKRFVLAMLKVHRIVNAIGDLQLDFDREQLEGYQALVELEILLSLLEDVRAHIKSKI